MPSDQVNQKSDQAALLKGVLWGALVFTVAYIVAKAVGPKLRAGLGDVIEGLGAFLALVTFAIAVRIYRRKNRLS